MKFNELVIDGRAVVPPYNEADELISDEDVLAEIVEDGISEHDEIFCDEFDKAIEQWPVGTMNRHGRYGT